MDLTRLLDVYRPEDCKWPIHVIGCGAIGGRVAIGLARMGNTDLHLWDFDKVGEENLCNQMYDSCDIGRPKAVALAEILSGFSEGKTIVHESRVDGKTELAGVVMLMTDTMSSRREIWEGQCKMQPKVPCVIEARMGRDCGRVYTLDPLNEKRWEETLCSDDVAEVSACGSPISVGFTADIMAGIALWQFAKFVNHQKDRDLNAAPEFEVLIGMRPFFMMTRA